MRPLALLVLLPALSGCYLLTQAGGQLRMLLNSRKIEVNTASVIHGFS